MDIFALSKSVVDVAAGPWLLFGSGRSLADGIAMMLMLLGALALLGVVVLIAHVVILVKLNGESASARLRAWNKGFVIFDLIAIVGCVVVFFVAGGFSGADSWKILPVAAVLALPAIIGWRLEQKHKG